MLTSPSDGSQITLQALSGRESIEIAIDTEFEDAHTLTIQLATRISPTQLAIQVYRSSAIPPIPKEFGLGEFLPTASKSYGRFFEQVVRWKTKSITPDLSPVMMLTDLFGLEDVEPISRHKGQARARKASNAIRKGKNPRFRVPTIRIVIIGHFLPADVGRMFGTDYYSDIFSSQEDGEQALKLANRKIVGLAYANSPFAGPPIVEYAADPFGNLFEIHLETRDTQIAIDRVSLDSLSRTYLGMGKSADITTEDKADMLRTFQQKTAQAYGYAIQDTVNTLLIYEQMQGHHASIYDSFGVLPTNTPAMKPSQGSRSSQFLVLMTAKAAGSTILAKQGHLKRLMKKGSRSPFGGERPASRFGVQTGQCHGGAPL